MRKRRYDIQTPTWTCPHCGFIHRPADLLRFDPDNLQCRQCKRGFQRWQPRRKPEETILAKKFSILIGLSAITFKARLRVRRHLFSCRFTGGSICRSGGIAVCAGAGHSASQ